MKNCNRTRIHSFRFVYIRMEGKGLFVKDNRSVAFRLMSLSVCCGEAKEIVFTTDIGFFKYYITYTQNIKTSTF